MEVDATIQHERAVNLISAQAAALSAPSIMTSLLAITAPLMMCSIVLSATESLDGRQRLAYRDDAFEAYVAKTPRLFVT